MQESDRPEEELEAAVPSGHVSSPKPTHQSPTQAESYHQQQARAIHRIYSVLHPDARITCVLKAMDSFSSSPNGVTIHRRDVAGDQNPEPWETVNYRDEPGYLTTYDPIGPARPAKVLVIAGVPREPVVDLGQAKTSPSFPQRSVRTLLWTSPVLFEQAKYRYEMQQLRDRPKNHSVVPVPRDWHRPPDYRDHRDLSKRPSILIGFHWLEMGGAEKLAFDSVKWARAAGFRVLILAERPEAQSQASKLPPDPDIEFIRTDAYLPHPLWGDFIDAIVRTENVRAVHIHHNTRVYDNLMRLKRNYPDLVTIDSTHIIEYSNGGFPRTSGVWTNYLDYHHVISRELAAFYLDLFGVSEKVKLGRMLDPAKLGTSVPEPVFNLKPGQKTLRLAFVGRMVHQKRAPLAVDIVRRVHRWAKGHGVAIHFDMVGTGAYLDVVKTMISRAGLRQVVTLHPQNADVPAILGQADILLLPSSNEGLALVCYEAIEGGAIPISTDVGGQDELIPESLLVPASPLKCVRAIKALIVRLMTEPEFLDRCKAELTTRYLYLRRDPTAERVLTALYRRILEETPRK